MLLLHHRETDQQQHWHDYWNRGWSFSRGHSRRFACRLLPQEQGRCVPDGYVSFQKTITRWTTPVLPPDGGFLSLKHF